MQCPGKEACGAAEWRAQAGGSPGRGEPGPRGWSLRSCRGGSNFSSGCSWEADPWQEAVAGRSHGGGGRLALGFSAAPSFLSSFSLPDPIPAPRSGSCCSRPDPRFPAPLWSPRSLFPGAGATSGRSQGRWGHGEDCAVPAEVPWAQGRASRAPGRGWRRNPAPSQAGAAEREPIPAWSAARGLPGGCGGVFQGNDLGRGSAGEGAALPRAGSARGLCGEPGEGGAPAPRVAPSGRASARALPRCGPGGRRLRGPLRRGAHACVPVLTSPTRRRSLHGGLVCLRRGSRGRGLRAVLGELLGERREEPNRTTRCPQQLACLRGGGEGRCRSLRFSGSLTSPEVRV